MHIAIIQIFFVVFFIGYRIRRIVSNIFLLTFKKFYSRFFSHHISIQQRRGEMVICIILTKYLMVKYI